MFEVGKKYEFRIIEGGDEIMFWGTIEKYEHPLIKLEGSQPVTINIISAQDKSVMHSSTGKSYPGRVINVTSPNFISAEEKIDDDDSETI